MGAFTQSMLCLKLKHINEKKGLFWDTKLFRHCPFNIALMDQRVSSSFYSPTFLKKFLSFSNLKSSRFLSNQAGVIELVMIK